MRDASASEFANPAGHWHWLLILWLTLGSSSSALGEGVVTEPTDAALRQALQGGGTVTLAFSGKLVLDFPFIITNSTVIDGTGYQPTISGGGVWRVFEVLPGAQFTLKGVTIADGKVQGVVGAAGEVGGPGRGGAIFSNGGFVSITNCVFTNNLAVGGAGGSSIDAPAGDGGRGEGGAICALGGRLVVVSSRFEANGIVGGEGGRVTSGLTPLVPVGDGGAGFGGAIYHAADELEVSACVFARNHATGGLDAVGRGAFTRPGAVGAAFGGALYAEGINNRLTGCRFEGNSAIWVPAADMQGLPGLAGGGAVCHTGSLMELRECTFVTNRAEGGTTRFSPANGQVYGGAVCSRAGSSLQVTRCEFRGNKVQGATSSNAQAADAFGGALFNEGTVMIQDSMLLGNQVSGGTPLTLFAAGRGFGGALWNTNTMWVSGCTMASNRAVSMSPYNFSGAQPAFGGALGNQGIFRGTNNTFFANNAEGGPGTPPESVVVSPGADAFGGAIYNLGGDVTLAYQTFAGNAAVGGPGKQPGVAHGGAILNSSGTITLQGVILANSTAGMNVEGSIVDAGSNLSSDTTPAFTSASSRKNVDPRLGPLANNGGPTPTMALLEGSPAIDAISSGSSGPSSDQRGEPRPSGAGSDIGAFEVDATPPPLWLTISVQAAGSVLLHVEGIQSSRHILERSSDLTTWDPIWTNATLPFDVLDTMVGPQGARWYRARSEP